MNLKKLVLIFPKDSMVIYGDKLYTPAMITVPFSGGHFQSKDDGLVCPIIPE
jgi:hypothetical protein